MFMPGVGVTFRVAPLAKVTGRLVTPLSVPKADVGLTFNVKPDVVGAGEAATVPSRACSRNFTRVANSGVVLLLASASMRWPLPMWVASNGGRTRLILSVRTLNIVLELTAMSTVTGEFDVPFESIW